MDKETQELTKQFKEERPSIKKKLPEWIKEIPDKHNPEEVKLKVIPTNLGNKILKENDYLIITNEGKEKLYEYNQRYGYWAEIPKGNLTHVVHAKLESENVWKAIDETNTYKFLLSKIERKTFDETFGKQPPLKFNFDNGVFNWETMKLEDHEKTKFDYFTNYSPITLDMANKPTPETDKYFKNFFGDSAKTMKQAVGYAFYPRYEPIQEFIILYGNGGDGKSWFLNNWLTNAVGKNLTANIALNELAETKGTNFKLSELFGKYINISSELTSDENKIMDTAILKRITGGENINASVKGSKDINFKPYAKLFIATNELIAFRDDKAGFKRRPYVIQCHKIKDFKNEINQEKLKEEMGSFIYKCIKEVNPLIEAGKQELTYSESTRKLNNKWFLDNDPIQQFIDECLIINNDGKEDKEKVENVYKNWCHDNNLRSLSTRRFINKMKDKGFGYEDHYLTAPDKKGSRKHNYTYTGFNFNYDIKEEDKKLWYDGYKRQN